ncbi:hypothetical protein [Pseudoalteromonas spongiae]|uniref:hypothetical protein n=1 Tax=Pseudoalteromonas spongiae TaxID=298657 RepID=UPI000C2D2132|nr:hypothetical protein [Pseudoalteromonas spongiae]
MDSITISGTEIKFTFEDAEVLEVKSFLKSDVQGDGSVSGGIGSLSVDTKHSMINRIWVKTSNGNETLLELGDITLRKGQKIRIIYASTDETAPVLSLIVNQSAGEHWYPCNANKLLMHFGIDKTMQSIVIATLIALIGFSLGGLGIVIAAVIILYGYKVQSSKLADSKKLAPFMESLAQKSY